MTPTFVVGAQQNAARVIGYQQQSQPCIMHQNRAYVFLNWSKHVISVGVLERMSMKLTTIVFTMPHTMVPWFAIQSLIRDASCTCNGTVDILTVEIMVLIHDDAAEGFPQLPVASALLFNSTMQRSLLLHFPIKPPRTNKVSCQTLCFVCLRIFGSPIRNKFADEIGHVTKSDLCRKSKGAWPDYSEASP